MAEKIKPRAFLNCAGNTFFLYEQEAPKTVEATDKADGLIYLWHPKSSPSEWQWRFFNNDGSPAEICGNASRGTMQYLDLQHPKSKLEFQSAVGKVVGEKSDNFFRVHWKLPTPSVHPFPEVLSQLIWPLNDRGLAFYASINSGVPHIVLINHDNWNQSDRISVSVQLQNHTNLQPQSTNVTWLSLATNHCVTFERGVKNETLACGSGAIAAFIALREYANFQKEDLPDSTVLNFPGGALKVELDSQQRIWLSGPSEVTLLEDS